MKKRLIIFALLGLLSCQQEIKLKEDLNKDCVEKIDPNKVCTAQYDPVCGCNLKTYGNACAASAASIRVIYIGECKK
jgi:Kazal-type serine protease inhibitor domain